jgi:hypothetical protein
MFHPKKKQRLLTFLAEEAASQPTTRPDTYILSSSGPALVAVSSNSSLLLNPVIRYGTRMENILVVKLKITVCHGRFLIWFNHNVSFSL